MTAQVSSEYSSDTSNELNRAVAIAVSGAGLIVAISWMLGLYYIPTFGAGNVSMKFSTAVCFIFTGSLFLTNRPEIRFGAGSMVLMIMVTSMMGFYTWDTASVYSVAPGVPSLATATLFALAVLVSWLPSASLWVGIVTTALSCLALFGYLVNDPAFYFYHSHVSTGMAIPTALVFLTLGLGFIHAGTAFPDSHHDYMPTYHRIETYNKDTSRNDNSNPPD